MAEAESAFARLIKVFFFRLFTTWWGSLDDAGKNHVEVSIAVVVGMGLLISVLIMSLRRQVIIPVQSPKPAIGAIRNSQIPFGNATAAQKRFSLYWTALNGEIRVGGLLCIAFLILAAFGSWPYNFYILTRIIVCFSFTCFAVLLHRFRRFGWGAAIAFWALLFNPIAPFHFAKGTWQLFNIAAVITLLPALFICARTQILIESKAKPLGSKALKAIPVVTSEVKMKSGTYRYCESCTVRVGRSDTFCKHCGAPLA